MAGRKLILPETYLITGEDPHEQPVFLARLADCIAKGFRFIQLRAKQLPENRYEELAKAALKLCREQQAVLLLNGKLSLIEKIKADGLHLTSSQLMTLQKRPFSKDKIIGASCHNEQEILQAKKILVDFITLSPVAPTRSHPDMNPLGWEEVARLALQIDAPVFALGGMSLADLDLAKTQGAHGVAGISSFWS